MGPSLQLYIRICSEGMGPSLQLYIRIRSEGMGPSFQLYIRIHSEGMGPSLQSYICYAIKLRKVEKSEKKWGCRGVVWCLLVG